MKATLISTFDKDLLLVEKIWHLDPPYDNGGDVIDKVVTSWARNETFSSECLVVKLNIDGSLIWPELGGGPNMTHEQALATIGYQVDSKE